MYPDTVFRSTEVCRTGAVVWGAGDLIKQTEFGIQPIKIGGGCF
jgi:hypothetical protein